MKSLSGNFLVASPQLRDPNFFQTVVLMIQHEPQGALGLVLNRPSEKTVQEVWEMVGKGLCDSEQPVHVGGPVPGPLLALHTHLSEADQEVLPGLFVTAQESVFQELIGQKEQGFRLFSGHAGWGEGQLDEELKTGGWLTTTATVEDVFSDHETLWKRMTSRIGLSILAPGVRPDQIPSDPGMN